MINLSDLVRANKRWPNGDEYHLNNDIDIEGIIRRSKGEDFSYISKYFPILKIHASMSTSAAPLPQKMPSVPLALKKHILNIVQAEELDVNFEIMEMSN
jgi:hypothetical protein